MRDILLSILIYCLFSFSAGATQVCGVYLIIEDFAKREMHTLNILNPPSRRQIHYTISNPETELVRGLFTGRCYCVQGTVNLDPEFNGDGDFRLLHVDSFDRGCNTAL